MLDKIRSAIIGTNQALATHRKALKLDPGVRSGVEQLQRICPADSGQDDERPIFLLSAGWRSGSTLLQRLIMSDPEVLIWGEPYDECGLIQALAKSMRAFRRGWPPPDYFYDGRPSNQLTGEWIANLFPSLPDWRNSQRALFDSLFSDPARRAGASRWGIKEVRLDASHCHYLRWLYPKARFVFLYRNPLEAYRSYCRYGRSWYDTFPDRPVFTPTVFGNHWRRLMEGFLEEAESLGAIVIRYEDIVSGQQSLMKLETHLGTHIDPNVLQTKVGSSKRRGQSHPVNYIERWLLKRAVGPLAGELGYHW